MKKINYLLVTIVLFLVGFSVTYAKTFTLATDDTCEDCIHELDYIIGTHVFTNAYIQENDFTTQMLMYGATTLDGSSLDNIKLLSYFGNNQMYDVITFEPIDVSADTTYEITHVDGVCVDPSCKGQTVNVTFQYNDGVTEPKEVSINYKETVSKPTDPTKLGYSFACWTKFDSNKCYDFSTPVEEDLVLEASWEAINYRITFVNTINHDEYSIYECSFGTSDGCKYQEFDKLFTLGEGYTFYGWSLAESGEKVYSSNTTFMELFGKKSEFTLYSIFNMSDYTISYNLNGGSFTGLQSPVTVYDPSLSNVNISTPSRIGYQFDGWFVTSGDAEVNGGTINITTPSNIEVEARWTPITYNVFYNKTIKLNTETCHYDENCTLNLKKIPVPAGKEIKSITATVGGTKYSIGEVVKNLTTVQNASVNVDIVTDDIDYNISYELDGGTVRNANPTSIAMGETITLNVPTKTGYTFSRWEVSGANATATNTSLVLNEAKDVKLTAVWTAHTYKLNYNGKTYANCTYDKACPLTNLDNNPTGKEFANWTYDSKILGTVVYNLTAENNKILEIVPSYNYVTYGITYNYDGGIVSTLNSNTYNVDTASITLTRPTKSGYTFKKWLVVSEHGKARISGDVLSINGETGTVKVSASYEPVVFNVNYDLDGGDGTIASHTCTYDACTITNVVPTKVGYDFAGWINNGTGYIYESGSEVKIDTLRDVTLTAKWSNKDSYKISYHLNDGTFIDDPNDGTTANTSYLAGETPVFTDASKVGYTFNGWLINNTGDPVTTAPSGISGDIELYASYTANTYNVTYMVSNYLDNDIEMTYTYDEVYTLENLLDEFSGKGYTLLGWSLNEGGSLYYGNALEFINLQGGTGDVTLYPVLQEIKDDYIISYYLDGGSFVDATTVDRSYNNGDKLVLPAVTKKGYKVLKWILEDGTFVNGNETDINRDIVLIPIWEKIDEYTVNLIHEFDSNIEPVSITCNFGVDCTLPSNTVSREYYTFGGWKLTIPGETGSTVYGDGDTLNLTWDAAMTDNLFDFDLKAVWNPVPFAVAYTGDGVDMVPGTYTIESEFIKLPLNADAGFISTNSANLVAWSDSEGSVIEVCADDANFACAPVPANLDNLSFLAHYDTEKYTVEYTVEYFGTTASDSQEMVYGSYLKDFLPESVGNRYKLPITGWYINGVEINLDTYRVTSGISLVGVTE